MPRISTNQMIKDIEDGTVGSKTEYGADALAHEYYGKNVTVDSVDKTSKGLCVIHMRSVSTSARCPFCGVLSKLPHGFGHRTVFDNSSSGEKTLLDIRTRRFKCANLDCTHDTFTEPLEFVAPYVGRTTRLDAEILDLGIISSLRGAASSVTRRGTPVSRTTVGRLLLSVNVIIVSVIVDVGVDDICKRRRLSYYTAIYDADTHMLLALMENRDGKGLADWLRAHPTVKVVRRDRASAYSSATREVLGDACMQVADKFHIFQNLNEYLKTYFYSSVPEDFRVYAEIHLSDDPNLSVSRILTEPPKPVRTLFAPDEKMLQSLSYDCLPPVHEDGSPVLFDFKMTDRNTKSSLRASENRSLKQKTALRVREYCASLEAEGKKVKYKKVAERFNISVYNVKQYLKLDDEQVSQMTAPVRYSKAEPASPFIYMIYKMMKDGLDNWTIFCYIKYKTDYSGSDGALETYIKRVGQNNFPDRPVFRLNDYITTELPENIYMFTRKDIIRCVLTENPDTKRNEELASILPDLGKMYPVIAAVKKCCHSFYEVMNSGDPDKLDQWIVDNHSIVPAFCNGLLMDIDAVKNAITTGMTSGFVEGNNTAFKLVKRMGCGRYETKLLARKFTLFLARKRKDFNPFELIRTRQLAI